MADKIPYSATINVAQINDAIAANAGDQTITAGLNALKAAMFAEIEDAHDCPQCAVPDGLDQNEQPQYKSTGKVDNGANICPLCNGMTKTSGLYRAKPTAIIYEEVIL